MDAKRKAIPKSIRMTVYQKCDGHCAYCGCDLEYKDMQVDHVVPLNGWSEHGTDTVDNMLPACRSCNHYKSIFRCASSTSSYRLASVTRASKASTVAPQS